MTGNILKDKLYKYNVHVRLNSTAYISAPRSRETSRETALSYENTTFVRAMRGRHVSGY